MNVVVCITWRLVSIWLHILALLLCESYIVSFIILLHQFWRNQFLSKVKCQFLNESCQMGKYHCVSYPLRVNNRVDYPFELVHSDTKEPCSLSSLGFRHFIIFVKIFLVLHTFSRVTWLYLMKHHSEAPSNFQTF